MKKHEKSSTVARSAPSRSTALIALPASEPRRGLVATAVRLLATVVLLPVRLPILALVALGRGVARVGYAAGRGLAATGRGLLRIPVLLARLVAMPFVGLAKGVAWVAPRAGRSVAFVAMLPVRLLVGIVRLLVMSVRALARVVMFILRIPFVMLRLAARGAVLAARGLAFGAAAVAIPVAALAWGAVRSVAAGVFAVARGIATAVAFLARLVGRGIALLFVGIYVTFRSLAVGIFVCLRAVVLALAWVLLLPFRIARILAVATARGIRGLAILFADAARTVAAGLVALARGTVAGVRLAARTAVRPLRALGAAVATREPQRAAFLPLVALAMLGCAEMFTPGFPFGTIGLLLLAAFSSLALLSRPVTMGAVLLAWAVAVACGWRAERIADETPYWIDALMYLASLAALRSVYVAVRAFATDAALAPRTEEQALAHRRASRAIGIALAAQCVAFAVWSLASDIDASLIFGELLLVGAGVALAWVVRTGQYVRAAQAVLTVGAFAAVVVMIAAQFSAFGAGRLVTPASLGAGLLLALVAGALIIVVHARHIDSDHGA